MPINYHAFLFTALISLSTFGIVSFSFPPNPSVTSSVPSTTTTAPPTPTTTPAVCTVANYSLNVGQTTNSYDVYTAGFDQPRNLFVVTNKTHVKLITPENVTIWDKETPCQSYYYYFRIFMDGSNFYVNGRCSNSTRYIAKYDGAGEVQWIHQISYSGLEFLPILINTSNIIVQDNDGNVHLYDSSTGSYIRNISLTLDMSIGNVGGLFLSGGFLYVSVEGKKTRVDGNGNEEFLFFFDPDQPPYYFYEYGNSITIDANGYMYESGYEAATKKAYVQKFSLNGTRIWYKILVAEFGNVNSYLTAQGFPNIVVISDTVYSVGATITNQFPPVILTNTTLTTYNATNGNVILAIPDFLSGPNTSNDHFSNFMLTSTNFYILTNTGLSFTPGFPSPIIISGYCPT